LKDIPRLPKRYFVPFVFSPQQTELLIKAVCKNIRKRQKYFLLDMAKYMAIVMLARCGMRINEPLHLQRCHYRKEEATVYIQEPSSEKTD
jgi:integrase/recombinase XerD